MFTWRAGIRRGNISSMLKRVCEKAGLPETFRPLCGRRHSFASRPASSGQVSMYELQKLLTHSSPQMTQRYAQLHDDALRKASDVAGALFSAVQNVETGQPSSREPLKSVASSSPPYFWAKTTCENAMGLSVREHMHIVGEVARILFRERSPKRVPHGRGDEL